MKVITEAILRDELRDTQIETYVIPEGKILSPAAREYLQQNKVKIVSSKDKPLRKSNIEVVATDVPPAQEPEVPKKVENLPTPKDVDEMIHQISHTIAEALNLLCSHIIER